MPEREPLDEDAAWAEIVAAYDEETAEPEPSRRLIDGRASGGSSGSAGRSDDPAGAPAGDGAHDGDPAEGTDRDRAAAGESGGSGEPGGSGTSDPSGASEVSDQPGAEGDDGRGGSTASNPAKPHRFGPDTPVNSVVVFSAGDGPRDWEAAEPDEDDDHFVPPEPPPLPPTDLTAKLAWIGAIGGPLLLIGAVLFQQPITWWMWILGIGGFLGGFVTLVARMGGDDEDGFDDPGRGAVV